MDEIRIFEQAHIPEVAALEMRIFHGAKRPAGAALQSYFAEIFFQNPWCDGELPSLVYQHNGRIVGFVGVIPRRMVFRGRTIRVAAASQLMVDQELYRGLAGLELMRRVFDGPQDLTITDGATEPAYTVWRAAGARVAQLYSLQWTRVLRPMEYYSGMLAGRPRNGAPLRASLRLVSPACALGDWLLTRLPVRALALPETPFGYEPAQPESLLECIKEIGWREALQPCYGPKSFQWLLDQAAKAQRHGLLRMAVVRSPSGSPAGWFVYYAKRGGVCKTLQFGAATRHFDEVLSALVRDASEQGGSAVSGQAIPRALLNLSNQHCAFSYPGNGVLVHSREPELLSCILRGDAALTRLDGEWWTRFAVGDWE